MIAVIFGPIRGKDGSRFWGLLGVKGREQEAAATRMKTVDLECMNLKAFG